MLPRLALSLVTVACSLVIVALVVTAPKSVSGDALPAHTPNFENGRIMFEAGGCSSCHMTPGQKNRTLLGGSLALKSPYGVFYPPNISPDPQFGIGRWSEADFVTAMHEGTSPKGANLFPSFPYTSYAHMRIGDVRDLFAYLKMLPPVTERSRAHELRFPFGLRPLVGIWKFLFFKDDVFAPDPNQSAEWNRGAYLINAPGHCAECHSPRNALGAVMAARKFTGGPSPSGEGKVPSITQANLESWAVKDIEALLENGETPDGDTTGKSMADVVENTAQLSPEDRHAMAVYVKSLAALPGEKKPD
jgi:mono/diheme cytochrome c family protein